MKIAKLADMKGGWFIGNFDPAAYKTDQFEVCFKLHPKGEKWPKHYHKEAVEINYLIRGSMTIQGELLEAGDIFIIDKHEVSDPEFHEDCEVIVVKTPSVPGDKYETD
jgi:quercetin dioxygenase-like cupin family protein